MPPSAWSDSATEELLGLAVDLLAVGDPRGATLLVGVLARECGGEFAQTIAVALTAGTPPAAFEFLPAPSGRLGTATGLVAGPEAAAATEASTPRPKPVRRSTAAATVKSAPVGGTDRSAPAPLPLTGYISAALVAAHFGVSTKAVYRWMADGRIRSERRPGGSYRIPADQFHTR